MSVVGRPKCIVRVVSQVPSKYCAPESLKTQVNVCCYSTYLQKDDSLEIREVPRNHSGRTLLRRIMWKRRILPTGRDILICQTHEMLVLSPILRQPPRSLVLSDVIPLRKLGLKPRQEPHERNAIAEVSPLKAFDLRLVFNAHHVFDV